LSVLNLGKEGQEEKCLSSTGEEGKEPMRKETEGRKKKKDK